MKQRSSPGEWISSIALALGLHLALILIVLLGEWLSNFFPPPPAAGLPIAAELVDPNSLSSAMKSTLRNRPEPAIETPPPPEPEPAEEEVLPKPVPEEQPQPQDFIVNPDTESQPEITELPTPVPAEEEKPQEAKQRQEQVDLTEQQRQQEAQRRERMTEMERERLRQIEDIRRRRAVAANEANIAEQKLQQLARARSRSAAEDAAEADAVASAPAGNYGADAGLQAKYAQALRQAILSKWTRPDSVPVGAMCRLNIRQIAPGEVISVEVASPCAYDEAGRRSIEAAVLKAQPLPYAGFESVFQRQLNLNFRAEDR